MFQIERFWKEVLRIEDDALVAALSKVSEFVRVPKGDILVRQGEEQVWITLIVEGVFRGFYLDKAGNEITDCFGFRPGEPAMACQRFDEPAEIFVEAVTDSLCVRFSVESMGKLCSQYPQLFQIYDTYLMQGIMRHQASKTAIQGFDLEKRYQWFLQEYPGLVDVARLKDIASFLKAAPESFSRMRANLKKNVGKEQG